MASTFTVDSPCCPEWAVQGRPVPNPRTLLLLAIVAVILVLAISPAVVALWSVVDDEALNRFYLTESARAGMVFNWLQIPARAVLLCGVWLLPAMAADR
jgi:hypothetical protein